MQHRQLPEGWDKDLPTFPADAKGLAGRAASAKILNAIAPNVPWLIGGSADLNESTKTEITAKDAGDFEPDNYGGRNFHFGIREHAMAAFVNGMSLVKVRPYGAGFFIFSDYARPSIRLSAIMEIPTIHIFTHDSIGVGEDGPTHQPIEQLPSLRAVPGLVVLRPADANECVEAWRVIMHLTHEPALLVLTRQDLPTLDRTKYAAASGLAQGAYILADAEDGKPDVLLMASGSEVQLCVGAYEIVEGRGDQGPRHQHAVLGTLRAPARLVQGQRDPARRPRPGLRRAGLDVRLGQVRRQVGRQDRHEHLRRLGPPEGAPDQVRLLAREGGRGRQGPAPPRLLGQERQGRRLPEVT